MGVFIAIALALAVGTALLLTRRISGGLKPVQARLTSLAENCLTDIEAALGGMASEGDVSVERRKRMSDHGLGGREPCPVSALGQQFHGLFGARFDPQVP